MKQYSGSVTYANLFEPTEYAYKYLMLIALKKMRDKRDNEGLDITEVIMNSLVAAARTRKEQV